MRRLFEVAAIPVNLVIQAIIEIVRILRDIYVARKVDR